ncbi:hypothetical protein IAU60_000241 [Kwoniella sp. DSM 27419]
MLRLVHLAGILCLIAVVSAANKDQWRGRSIYQLVTDRFAGGARCDLGSRSYCGGNWRAIISKLDYIQGMGFQAIWISPTALNLEGYTKYGEAYHGYWTADPTRLNPHFGDGDDLKALSAALHSRGMYLMVDIAINALAATDYHLDAESLASDAQGNFLFRQVSDFHPRCPIQWGNTTSEQFCWLVPGSGDNDVALLDLATEKPQVADVLKRWIRGYVREYGIDGLRIDASKHMGKPFQHDFCKAAGVFCMGEVAGDNTLYAGTYQGDDGIDAVFGFGMMYGLSYVFGNGDSMDRLPHYIKLAAKSYPDPTLIGTFLDNQDLPRINSRTSDRSRINNAIVASFMYGGIPIVYYGLEQDIADGPYDPNNREALWNYNDYNTQGDTYKLITRLNKIRQLLNPKNGYKQNVASVLQYTAHDIALVRGDALIVLTNRGTSGSTTWLVSGSKLGKNASAVDLLSCTKVTTDVKRSLSVTFTYGQPFVFVPASIASSSGLCSK